MARVEGKPDDLAAAAAVIVERVDLSPPAWWNSRRTWLDEVACHARSGEAPSTAARKLVGLPFSLSASSVRDAVTRARGSTR